MTEIEWQLIGVLTFALIAMCILSFIDDCPTCEQCEYTLNDLEKAHALGKAQGGLECASNIMDDAIEESQTQEEPNLIVVGGERPNCTESYGRWLIWVDYVSPYTGEHALIPKYYDDEVECLKDNFLYALDGFEEYNFICNLTECNKTYIFT